MAKQRIAPNPNVGQNLQFLMAGHKTLGSQPALAAATGLAQSTVGRILRSEVEPTASNLQKIASALNVKLEALYLSPEKFKAEHAQGLLSSGAEPVGQIAGTPHDGRTIIHVSKPLSVGTVLQAVSRATRDLPPSRKRAIDALASSPTTEIDDGDAAAIDNLAGGLAMSFGTEITTTNYDSWLETAMRMAANWPAEDVKPFLMDFVERVQRAQVDKDQLAKLSAPPAPADKVR